MKIETLDGNSFTPSDTANRDLCVDIYSLLRSSQFTHRPLLKAGNLFKFAQQLGIHL